jgi:hypothetical protein
MTGHTLTGGSGNDNFAFLGLGTFTDFNIFTQQTTS